MPSVAVADPPGGAREIEPKLEPAGMAGTPRAADSIDLDIRLPITNARSAGTKAAQSRIRPEPSQLHSAEDRLKAAKTIYEQAKDQANKQLLEGFDNAMRNVDPHRTKSAVSRQILKERLSKEREEFSKDHRALPDTEDMLDPVIDYLFAIVAARAPLSRAYESLVEVYEHIDELKAKELALEADKLKRELGEAQPLHKGGAWEGSLRSKVEHLPLCLRIVKRQELDFEAEVLFKGGIVKARATGQFDGLQIKWSTEPIPNDGAVQHWNFRGIVWRGWLVGVFEEKVTDTFGDLFLSDRGQIRLELRH
jgi:hypothetical protein